MAIGLDSEPHEALSASAPARSKGLHIALWIAQVLLAVLFTMAGLMKSTSAIPELAQKLPWVLEVPEAMVRFIGVSELLGGLGLILPAATRIKPSLTPFAATGLVVIMLLASAFHLSRGEVSALPINFTLGALAAFVAWGRFRKAPIAPRA
jgi:putative oxidoreductase